MKFYYVAFLLMTSFLEQVENLWSGKHIATKHDKNHDILLCQIDGFFVEVYYPKENDTLRKFEPVANRNQLLFYRNQIDINRLLKIMHNPSWKLIYCRL